MFKSPIALSIYVNKTQQYLLLYLHMLMLVLVAKLAAEQVCRSVMGFTSATLFLPSTHQVLQAAEIKAF